MMKYYKMCQIPMIIILSILVMGCSNARITTTTTNNNNNKGEASLENKERTK